MLLGDLRIWDGESNAALPAPSALRVEGQRIVDIGPQAALADGAETLSFPGCTAIPGLIDGHVHLVLDPEIVDPLEQVVAIGDGANDVDMLTVAGLGIGVVTVERRRQRCQRRRRHHVGGVLGAPDPLAQVVEIKAHGLQSLSLPPTPIH